MNGVTVDASVWVAAAELSDPFCSQSRAFLARVAGRQAQISVPAFARVEIACALARRRQDVTLARQLTDSMLAPGQVVQVPVDPGLIERAVLLGTRAFLRGADALYPATAQLVGDALISWDDELIQRAGALTPSAWLAANA